MNKKLMKQGFKGLLIFVGISLLIVLLIYGKMMFDLNNLSYHPTNLSAMGDGVYTGLADATLVKVKVEVTVKDHQIVDINLIEHQNGQGEKAEAIVNDMIEENAYEVDAINGATVSSEVIKSAVSDALTGK